MRERYTYAAETPEQLAARAAEEQAHREFVLANLEIYYRDARVSEMSCAEAANEPARFRSAR